MDEEKKSAEMVNKMPHAQYQYDKDKRGWVVFTNGKKKIKLRQHVENLANGLTRMNGNTFIENRLTLIKIYEAYGLKSLAEFYAAIFTETHKEEIARLTELKNKLKNEANETNIETKDSSSD